MTNYDDENELPRCPKCWCAHASVLGSKRITMGTPRIRETRSCRLCGTEYRVTIFVSVAPGEAGPEEAEE